MNSNPSLNWQRIQDVYYSLRSCYETLDWSIGNLHADYSIKWSSNSTLLALSSKHAAFPSVIDIHGVGGTKIWSVFFNSTPMHHIVDYQFHNECLVVVLNNQLLRYYRDLKGNFIEYCYTKDLVTLDDFGDTNVLRNHSLTSSSNVSTNGVPSTPTPKNHGVITNLENHQQEEVFQVLNTFVWGRYLFLRLPDRFIITDLVDFKNYQIPISDSLSINCINLILVHDGDERLLNVVICFASTVVTLKINFSSSSYEVVDHGLTDGPFTAVTVSPNGQLIALLNPEVSTIFVINNTFTQVLLEYDTSNDSSLPYQIQWCGNDAIVLALRDEVKLLGPSQASISFFYDMIEEEDLDFDAILKGNGNDELSFTIPFLKSEPDGLKILSTNKLEFLSRVPDCTLNLYRIGSSHPSSILLDCMDKLVQNSSKADANITLLKSDGQLVNAMNSCLEAALDEFNSYWQKKILLAVSFGKAYNDDYYDSDKYIAVINTLKVLNQLRAADIAIFLTFKQIEAAGWNTVIDMLLTRSQYLLALKIISLLDLQYLRDKIYTHWCCYKIKKELDLSDIDLFKIISHKLSSAREEVNGGQQVASQRNYLSVIEISEIAYEEGRIDLCKLLIDLEPSIVKKIEQYLKFDELEIALVKSFENGEYDLSKLLLLNLYDTLSVSQFFKILHQNEQKNLLSSEPLANDANNINQGLFVNGDLVEHFWIESIGKHDQAVLEKYFKQEDMKLELAIERFKEYIRDSASGDLGYYDMYKQHLLKLLSSSGDRRNFKFYQQELEILELRKRLSEIYQLDFYEFKNLPDILIKLINMHQLKQAFKIVKDFKVSSEKFWYLVVETYAKTKEFERLHQFIVSSSNTSDMAHLKSPIGFRPIVETCLNNKGLSHYISIYISNCTDIHYSEKIEMFVENNDLLAAANEAYRYKDIEFLNSLYERATKHANDSTAESIKSLITRLGY